MNWLEFVPDAVIQRNFETLARNSVDTGGRQMALRGGEATVTWPGASTDTDVLTVTHGLGRTPQSITLAPRGSLNVRLMYTNENATTFEVQGRTADGTSPAAATTRDFSWQAIG